MRTAAENELQGKWRPVSRVATDRGAHARALWEASARRPIRGHIQTCTRQSLCRFATSSAVASHTRTDTKIQHASIEGVGCTLVILFCTVWVLVLVSVQYMKLKCAHECVRQASDTVCPRQPLAWLASWIRCRRPPARSPGMLLPPAAQLFDEKSVFIIDPKNFRT